MNYRDPELLDRLAREYVLGTLHGPARRRFDGLLGASVVARRSVLDWEHKLVPLALDLAPVLPPAKVWERLATELGFRVRRPPGRPWAAIAAGLSAVGLALGLFAINRSPPIQVQVREVLRETAREPAYIVVMADKGGKPLWSLNAYPELKELRVHAFAASPLASGQVYELWMLPDSGAAPISLGLLPETGNGTLPLDGRRLAVLASTSTLAVSREPAGGSPTGVPTGPVLYTAPLVHLGS